MNNLLNGVRYYTAKETGAVFIPLPRELWAPALMDADGNHSCDCPQCKGADAWWDTLVIPGHNDRSGTTFTVHMPQLQIGMVPEFLKK